MKKTKVKIKMNSGKIFEIPGYAFESNGVPLVLHRNYYVPIGADVPKISSEWQATEPRSGLKFTVLCDTREEAIKAADERFKQYGKTRVLDMIERAARTPA